MKQAQTNRGRTASNTRLRSGIKSRDQDQKNNGNNLTGTGYSGDHSFANIQASLKVRNRGDQYEQEADRMADLVSGPGNIHVTKSSHNNTPSISMKSSGPSVFSPLIESHLKKRKTNGEPLHGETRAFMENRFGADFRNVRIHNDNDSAVLNDTLNARAFTIGRDIYFNKGQFNPSRPEGRKLLAHELTHVIQQNSSDIQSSVKENAGLSGLNSEQVQGSFFGDLWEGIKSVGRAIGSAVSSAFEWIGEKLQDAAMWVVNLFRDLPERLMRFGETIVEGLQGIVSFVPEAIKALKDGGISGFGDWLWEKAKAGGYWVLRLVSRIFDLVGGPEIIEFIDHVLTKASPLTSTEITEAQSVLGPNAIRWNDVRVAEGGLLNVIFKLNDARAFTSFHTINLPNRADMPIVVHELVHVYQYEKAGSLYLGQAIHAQATVGYEYGDAPGLIKDRREGKHYKDYNREQQAQIAEDYYKRKKEGRDTSAHEPFIAELQAGKL